MLIEETGRYTYFPSPKTHIYTSSSGHETSPFPTFKKTNIKIKKKNEIEKIN